MSITKKEITEDFKRFIRHEAMRANTTQDEVLRIITSVMLTESNSVDGVVTFDYYDKQDREIVVVVADDVIAEEHGLHDNDEVKLIIVKED